MGNDFLQDLEIGLNLLETGITEVIDLGKYIAIVGIKKNKIGSKIYFFDTRTKFTRAEFSLQITELFSEITCEKFMYIYDLMVSESSPNSDNVELFMPLES